MDEEIKVNDGGGLLNSYGLIDSLILDCNESVKKLIEGNYIAWCNRMSEMVKKLALLKDGVKKDTEGLQRQVEELRRLLETEGGQEDAAGSVCDTLDGTLGGGEERLRDAVLPEGGGLEQDPDHPGA